MFFDPSFIPDINRTMLAASWVSRVKPMPNTNPTAPPSANPTIRRARWPDFSGHGRSLGCWPPVPLHPFSPVGGEYRNGVPPDWCCCCWPSVHQHSSAMVGNAAVVPRQRPTIRMWRILAGFGNLVFENCFTQIHILGIVAENPHRLTTTQRKLRL